MGSNLIPATYTDPVTGDSIFNEAALFVRPHWLCTDPDVFVFPAAAAPVASSSTQLAMEVSQEAPFLGSKLLVFRDRAVFVQIYDKALRRWIAKAPIHLDSIAGWAGDPFVLLDPMWIEAGDDITVRFSLAQVGLGADEVKLYVEGARYFHKDANIPKLTAFVERKREEHRHNYLTFLTTVEAPVDLAGFAVGTYFVEIPPEYWFTLKKITAVAAAGGLPAQFSIQLFDHRGNPMSNGPLDSRAVMGVGINPEVLRQPYTIPPNRRIRMVITNLAAGPSQFYLTFTGAAHYVKGR